MTRLSFGLAVVAVLALSAQTASAQERIEFLGDSAAMASPYKAKRLMALDDYYYIKRPCVSDASLTCEGHRFAWSARPSDDTVWEALKKVPAKTEDLVSRCRVDHEALVDCKVNTASGGEPSAAVDRLARDLLAAFKTPAKDLMGFPSQDAEVEVPFHWRAIKAALDGGPGSRPLLKATVKPFGGRWKAFGPAGPYTPDMADRQGVKGTAIVDCQTGSDGKLADCAVVNEYPREFGFGDATLRMVEAKVLSVEPRPAPERVWVVMSFGR